jgi:hypothetical protein
MHAVVTSSCVIPFRLSHSDVRGMESPYDFPDFGILISQYLNKTLYKCLFTG